MYASIRKYQTSDAGEVARRAEEGFIPIVNEIEGVSAWYLVDGGSGTLITVTVAENEAAAEASVEKAREWVGENAADLVEGAPEVHNGEVLAST